MINEPKKSVELTEKELESVVGGLSQPQALSKGDQTLNVLTEIEKTRGSKVEAGGRTMKRPWPNL